MDFLVLFEFVFLSVLFAILLYLLSFALQKKRSNDTIEKSADSETEQDNNAKIQYLPSFFTYALCFLLFEAQCVLMLPFAYISKALDIFYIVEIMIFVLILILGLLFGIKSELFELD